MKGVIMLLALLLVTHQEQRRTREHLMKILDREAPDIAYKLYQSINNPNAISHWLWNTTSESKEPLAKLVHDKRYNELDSEIRRKLPQARYA